MKLSHCRLVGRFIKPDGHEVNVHTGRNMARGVDVLFYLYRGSRNLISDADFYKNWRKS